VIQRQDRPLQRRQRFDLLVQRGAELGVGARCLEVEVVGDTLHEAARVLVGGRLRDRDPLALEMAPRDRVSYLPDPGLQGALEPGLIEVAMHAQKRVLAELARVVGLSDHAVDNVPTEPLMVADQRLERAARAGQYGRHQQPIGVDGVWLARTDPARFDDRWLPGTHPVIDTPNRASVASPGAGPRPATGRRGPVSTAVRSRPYRPGIEASNHMRFEVLIPITLFFCITYAIKLLVDARTRSKLIAANGSEELIRSLVQNEEQQRRHASVRWGVVLVCLAVGFALIEFFGWDDVTPGAIAVLLGATGVGNLVSFYISRDLPK
jgi:hypothetical protein